MGLKISGLNQLRERLERLRPEEVMARALAEQAQRMAARVREGLSEPPGRAGHDEPWLRSGALRDSVGAQTDGLQAVVGSSDPAAVPQELGTAHMPARPFLAPVAAEMGEEVARTVGAVVAAALRGASTDANGTGVDLGGGGLNGDDPPNRSGVAASALASSANTTRVGGSLSAANGASFDGFTPSLFGVLAADGRDQYHNLIILAKTPNSGELNTWYVNPGSGQMRLFDPSGKPALDLDYDHPHDGIQPHMHTWLDGVRGPGITIPNSF